MNDGWTIFYIILILLIIAATSKKSGGGVNVKPKTNTKRPKIYPAPQGRKTSNNN